MKIRVRDSNQQYHEIKFEEITTITAIPCDEERIVLQIEFHLLYVLI